MYNGHPPPPVVIQEEADLTEEYVPLGKPIIPVIKKIPIEPQNPGTDPRTDPTARTKFNNRKTPYCPPKKTTKIKYQKPETFIPRVEDSPRKFSPGRSLIMNESELFLPNFATKKPEPELFIPNIEPPKTNAQYPPPAAMAELTSLLEDIQKNEKYAYQAPQFGQSTEEPLTLCAVPDEPSMIDLFGPSTPVQDETPNSTTQQADKNIPILNEPNPDDEQQIPFMEISSFLPRKTTFSDYQDFLDITPTENTQNTNQLSRRPTCIVVGYPIAIRYPEQLANLQNPSVDLERLFNSIE